MSSSIADIYIQLLKSDRAQGTLQRRAVELFCSTKKLNSKLSAAIFSSPNLPAELADQVCAHGGPKELGLWLAMPGRTAEQVTARLKKEKRVTVLSSVADRTDLPQEVYENLIQASRNPKVLIRLIPNEGVSERNRIAAAVKALSGSSGARHVYQIVEVLPEGTASKVAVKVDQVDSLFALASNCSTLDQAAGDHVAKFVSREIIKAHRKELERIADGYYENSHRYYRYGNENVWPALQALDTLATDGCIPEDATQRLIAEVSGYLELWQTEHPLRNDQYVMNQTIKKLADTVAVLEASSEKSEPLAGDLTAEELDIQADLVINLPASNIPRALDIALHPAATLEIAKKVWQKIPNGSSGSHLIGTLLSQGRYSYAIDLLTKGNIYVWLRDEAVERAPDPVAFLSQYVDALFASEDGYYRRSNIRSVLQSKFSTPEMLMQIPAEALVFEDNEIDSATSEAFVEMLESTLGDDDSSWSVFETLVNDGGISLSTAAETASLL